MGIANVEQGHGGLTCGSPGRKIRGRKVKLKYSEVLSVAAPVVARSLAQFFFSGKIRLLTSAATMFVLATNAWAGKPVAPAAPSNLAATAAPPMTRALVN